MTTMRPFPTLLPALIGLVMSVSTASAQRAEKLFDTKDVLHLRIVADFGALMRERDSTKLKVHPATLTYTARDGQIVTKPAELELRGHWRRQKRNCDFAPISLDFPSGARAGTIFADQGKLKLVTHCRSRDREFEQYVLREYQVYELLSVLTPIGLRARLVRATYVDSGAKVDSVIQNAFFIENEKRAAARNGAVVLDVSAANWSDVVADQTALVSLFEYMVGGSDWSLRLMHNVVLFRDTMTKAVSPMPYDFDWTGIVDTKYAFPDKRLEVNTVRNRVYRGLCRTPDEWAPTLSLFQAKKAALYAVYGQLPQLDSSYAADTWKYLNEFYEVIGDPKKFAREIISKCQRA
jgi:hypothetical protein